MKTALRILVLATIFTRPAFAEQTFQVLTDCRGLQESPRISELEQRLASVPLQARTATSSLNAFRESCQAYLTNPTQNLSSLRSIQYDAQGAMDASRAFTETLSTIGTLATEVTPYLNALGLRGCVRQVEAAKSYAARKQALHEASAANFRCGNAN